MGWAGEMQEKLIDSAKDINKYPKHSLGWYLAVITWNDACWELSCTGNADDSWFDGIEITNADIDPAEIDDHDEASRKMLAAPSFKKDQILEVEHGTTT